MWLETFVRSCFTVVNLYDLWSNYPRHVIGRRLYEKWVATWEQSWNPNSGACFMPPIETPLLCRLQHYRSQHLNRSHPIFCIHRSVMLFWFKTEGRFSTANTNLQLTLQKCYCYKQKCYCQSTMCPLKVDIFPWPLTQRGLRSVCSLWPTLRRPLRCKRHIVATCLVIHSLWKKIKDSSSIVLLRRLLVSWKV